MSKRSSKKKGSVSRTFVGLLFSLLVVYGFIFGSIAAISEAREGSGGKRVGSSSADASATPCPAGAPVRQFNITAIKVPIVYNNWGDVDDKGMMFALESQSYTGTGGPNGPNPFNSSSLIDAAVGNNPDTPVQEVQPLVLRANMGDCIKINLTNRDISNAASVTIRRAQYNVLNSEGGIVGNNATPAPVAKGQMRTFTFFIEDKPENQGVYHFWSQTGDVIDAGYHGLWGALMAEPKGSRYFASQNPWKGSSNSLLNDPSNFATSDTTLTWASWEAIIVPCVGVAPGQSAACDRLFNSPGGFNNGRVGNAIVLGGAPTANSKGAFREFVTFYHDGIFIKGGLLNRPDKKMAFPPGPSETASPILPIKGEQLSSGLWGLPDGGSLHGQRFSYSTPAGILGTRGWGFMGPSGPVDPGQPNSNNTSFNDDFFNGASAAHEQKFGKALNYRSDPFSFLKAVEEDEALSYNAYAMSEPSTPIPQAYLGDPTIWRIVHGGGEEHHIQHHHGYTRWPEQPYEDLAIDPLTGDLLKVGGQPTLGSKMYLRGIVPSSNLTESLDMSASLLKYRMDTRSTVSNIVDIQFIGPHEHYDQELEGGAGSTHGSPADYVDHCHVSDHYPIGMWRYQRNYNCLQSNIAKLPGRPTPLKAVNSIDLLTSGKTIDGKSFCSKTVAPEHTKACQLPINNGVDAAGKVVLEDWIAHLLPSRGVHRQGIRDPRIDNFLVAHNTAHGLIPTDGEVEEDAEVRNPAFDPFDANRNGWPQDPDGNGFCDSQDFADSNGDGKCDDGGDPADWKINPPCPSLDGAFDPNSAFGQMSLDGHRALACIINGYDGDHLDWRFVNLGSMPLTLNQPDGPLFQNFIPGRGDYQGRWARYREAKMYKLVAGSVVSLGNIGPRPGMRAEMLFNPQDGRLEFPWHRPFRGMRPPWPPNNHSGAPSVGETVTVQGIAPEASRQAAITATIAAIGDKNLRGKYPNGLCPQNAPVRSYDIVIFTPLNIAGTGKNGEVQGIIYNRFGDTDPNAAIHALRNDEVDVLGGKRLPQQLAIRGNVGDCIDLQYRSHITDFNPLQDNFSKINMHIHMIQFDITASDGVVVGGNWEQAARPCTDVGQVADIVSAVKDLNPANLAGLGLGADPTVTKTIGLAPKMQYTQDGPPALGGGFGPKHNVIVPDAPDAVGRVVNALKYPGRPWEYAHYRWYADIQMMAFWHPHLGGFLAFPLGVANGIVLEPEGSKYQDRITGEEKYTHSNKVTQSPVTGQIRSSAITGPAESGTPDGYPFAGAEAATFGGNPELGWALGDLDYEEQTKVINWTAHTQNRKAQTGEDIPTYGKLEKRGGPSGLKADDCGGVSQLSLHNFLVSETPLTPDNNLKLSDMANPNACPDETNPAVFGAPGSVATAGKSGTLNTNRVFNRTRSLYSTGGVADPFNVTENSGGTQNADIITTADNDLGVKVEPSFREQVFWWMDDIYLMIGDATNRVQETKGKSAIVLKNEPLDRRVSIDGLPIHRVFTTPTADLDPSTPLLLAHPGDRYILRSFDGATQDLHTFRFLGHRFGNERHSANTNPMDAVQDAIGFFYQYELMGGAGASFIDPAGQQHNMPGDYLYYMSIAGSDLADGGWGILRVGANPGLQALDDSAPTIAGGDPCAGAAVIHYDVTAVSVSAPQARNIFVLADASGNPNPGVVAAAQPLVLRANAGDCVEVTMHPHHMSDKNRRVGLTSGLVVVDPNMSYGVNVGNNAGEQTVGSAVAGGTPVTYKWLAQTQRKYDSGSNGSGIGQDAPEGSAASRLASAWTGAPGDPQSRELGTAFLCSLTDPVQDLNDGLFGALIVEPEGSSWTTDGGTMGDVLANVTTPAGLFREIVVIMHEQSEPFQSSFRPQENFKGSINYRQSGGGPPFNNVGDGLAFTANAGQPTKVRLIYANGSEDRTFTVHGHRWQRETATPSSNNFSVVNLGPGMRFDIDLEGNDVNGDGKADLGVSKFKGDYFVGVTEHRSAMGGQWGVIRVQ